MFKHVIWLLTIAKRDVAREWIKHNFDVFTDEAFVLSKIYTFYTAASLNEEQVAQISNIVGLEEHFLNEEM
ncbi:MAG TPA: hypothetical protein VHV10_05115 [Ktedonobacteraceae bacterium]|nr:hypothetical protein [Ktedonobacteraceae bacterium]